MSHEIIEDADTNLWDELTSNSRNATLFHTSAWLNSAPGRWKKMVIVDCNNIPLAGIAEEHTEFRQLHGNSITPYEGPLLRDHRLTGSKKSKHDFSLLAAFEQALLARGTSPFMTSPWLEDLRPFVIGRWNVSLLYTNVLDRTQMDMLEKNISATCRSTVNSAKSKGITVSIHEDAPYEIIDKVLGLAEKSYGRQNLKLRFNLEETRHSFRQMAEKGHAFFALAHEKNGDISCGIGIFFDDTRAHFLISGQDREKASSGAVNLALYESIIYAASKGVSEFDFEGSFLGGVDRFFREFGGNPRPFYEICPPK